MWNCPKCREELEDAFETCWRCGTDQSGKLTEHPESFDRRRAQHLGGRTPTPAWLWVWLRCWLWGACVFTGVYWHSSFQPRGNDAWQLVTIRCLFLASLCGTVLLLSSFLIQEKHSNFRRIARIVGIVSVAPFLVQLLAIIIYQI